MKALLLLAHGSPRPTANRELLALAETIRAGVRFGHVEVGFLECNAPSIPEAIDACVAAGADTVVAVPYFLHIGTHVAQDLPELLDEGRARHPGVAFRLSDYVGLSARVTDLLADRARADG